MSRISSYQKLKARVGQLESEVRELVHDPESIYAQTIKAYYVFERKLEKEMRRGRLRKSFEGYTEEDFKKDVLNGPREQEPPYCTDCGGENPLYMDQYANGEQYKCRDCGKEFMWTPTT